MIIADITQVLNTEIFLHKKDPSSLLAMERFDLSDLEAFPPYLLVRGLEDWFTEEMLEEHFEAEAQGAKIKSVDVTGSEAKIVFADPQGSMVATLRRGREGELF